MCVSFSLALFFSLSLSLSLSLALALFLPFFLSFSTLSHSLSRTHIGIDDNDVVAAVDGRMVNGLGLALQVLHQGDSEAARVLPFGIDKQPAPRVCK